MDLGKDMVARRRMILTRATIAEGMFEEKGVSYIITQLFTDGFCYEMQTGQSLDEIVRQLFLKWDDVVNVTISAGPVRLLGVTFQEE